MPRKMKSNMGKHKFSSTSKQNSLNQKSKFEELNNLRLHGSQIDNCTRQRQVAGYYLQRSQLDIASHKHVFCLK